MKQDYSFQTDKGHELNMSLYSHAPFGENPCIIYTHGFKGFKDWGFVPFAGEYFANKGFSFLCFNFSHNGIGEDMENFTELSKFEQNTFSLEVSELQEVIKLACHTTFFGNKATAGLGLIGHSRGGGIALLGASRQAEIQAVCTWASVSSLDRYSKGQIQEWEKKGYMEVKNSRTGQVLKMGRPMLTDIQKNGKGSLNILKALKDMEKPLLILHGAQDETVPPFEAEQLSIFAKQELTEMRMIPGAGHTFGAKHPFAGSTSPLDLVLSQTEKFFSEHLS
ncbi:MAG: prolyl oligopeptidase family serine peptidase [Bacteroidota bacterium]